MRTALAFAFADVTSCIDRPAGLHADALGRAYEWKQTSNPMGAVS